MVDNTKESKNNSISQKYHAEKLSKNNLEKARQYVNAWASLKWHRIHGGEGFPVTGEDGLSASCCRRGGASDMPSIFDAAVTVDYCLKRIGSPPYLKALLLWLYPTKGTYAREESISNFCPEGLNDIKKIFGWTRSRLEKILQKDEKIFLSYLATKI